MDAQLGSLMKAFKGLKKKRNKGMLSKNEKQLLYFRNRVGDFIEIVIKEAHSVEHICHVIIPILQALDTFDKIDKQKPLVQKLRSLIHDFSQVKTVSKTDDKNNSVAIICKTLTNIYTTFKSKCDIKHLF